MDAIGLEKTALCRLNKLGSLDCAIVDGNTVARQEHGSSLARSEFRA